MTDTWGIPGPTFLWAFIGIAALIVVGAVAHRRRILTGPGDLRADRLTPAEVAYLSEGPSRAAYATLATLTKAGVVLFEDNGRMRRTGGIHAGATALESAVLHAAGDGERAALVPQHRSVRSALGEMDSDLTRRGLLVSADDRRAARFGAWILLALFVFGAIRVLAGISSGRPVMYLVLELLAVAAAFVLLYRVPRLTASAKTALQALRREHHYFEAKHRPAWQTYDPAMTGLAVGLFGTALLWDANPEMAEAAGLRASAGNVGASSAGYSCSGGSDGGGGSSDGGGGGGGCGGGGGGCGG